MGGHAEGVLLWHDRAFAEACCDATDCLDSTHEVAWRVCAMHHHCDLLASVLLVLGRVVHGHGRDVSGSNGVLLLLRYVLCSLLALILEGLALGLLIRIEAQLGGVVVNGGLRLFNRRQLLGALVEEGVNDLGRVFVCRAHLNLILMLVHLIEVVKTW